VHERTQIQAKTETPSFSPSPSLAAGTNLLQRKCACGGTPGADGECAECRNRRLQRRDSNHAKPEPVPPIVHEALRSPGQPLDEGARAFMEPRFGHDFSKVRVHTDGRAAESARAVNALAYTVGRDIFLARGQYDPRSSAGHWILAHELTHVVQQRDEPVAAGERIEMAAPERYEREANAAATAVPRGFRSPPIGSMGDAAVMRLTPGQFRTQLGATPDQKAAIDALFANKTFLSLWDYIKKCPVAPKKDLGPLTLKVTPGLKIGPVERFGGYSPFVRTLEINPTKPEHKANPAELVDTITHELFHAVDDLQAECVKAGAKAAPLAGGATESPPQRADIAGTPQEKKLMQELGPGASDPCEEFIDINKAAQQMIIQIIKNNIQVAKVGRPTLIFVNEILRTNPKAMTDYVKCRDVACANPVAADRSKAMAACSANILSKYMPPLSKPTHKPPSPAPPKHGT
jgi:hypothetical protein